ncbi:hypothetical protein G5B38_15405 [Pseudohalocynthiibacter aestuariivivens]|nr:hypothetical protein [Pseudohalocynthiibacter aestuariivivens]QIE46798.1 hypothetical protein G5B38_15405 [Pseudohalocynthiibacter aestuariivivens]
MQFVDNIQRSEFVIACILNCLMERGISSAGMQFSDVSSDTDLKDFFAPCLEWLKAEGIIRFSSTKNHGWPHGGPAFHNVTLTSKGFKILGENISLHIPNTHNTELTSHEKVADVVSSVARSRKSYSQFGDFFGGLLGGFTKSIGS